MPKNFQQWEVKRSIEKDTLNHLKVLSKKVKQLSESVTDIDHLILFIRHISNTEAWQKYSEALAHRMYRNVIKNNFTTWRQAAYHSGNGRIISKLLKQEFVNTIMFREKIEENAKLFKSIPELMAKRVSKKLSTAAANGQRSESFEKELRKELPGLTNAHVKMIARTEVAKAQSAITEIRAESLGLKAYVWRTSEDERVRPSHRIMDGVICFFEAPPNPEKILGIKSSLGNYNAGSAPNCRCYEETVLEVNDLKYPVKVAIDGRIVSMRKEQFLKVYGG